MNTRLQQFISAENLTQSQFADSLGVARAGISHVLSGRNRPGYDFFRAIALKYPRLNLEWLITGKGKMYKEPDIFAHQDVMEANSAPSDEINTLNSTPQLFENKKIIEKVLIFFSDGTFTEIA